MGNDEHSQNVFKQARWKRASIRWPTATGWSRSSGGPGQRLDLSFDDFIRTTQPRHAAGVTRAHPAHSRRRRHLRRRLRRLVLRQLRGVQAGKGSRQRQLPAASHAEARVDPREELLLPAVEVSAAAARPLRRASRVHAAGESPQRDPAAHRRRAARTFPSAAPGSRGAFRCRSIRRASSTSGSTR